MTEKYQYQIKGGWIKIKCLEVATDAGKILEGDFEV